jgi:hypothetical protein
MTVDRITQYLVYGLEGPEFDSSNFLGLPSLLFIEYLWVRQTGCVADHSLPFITEIKKVRSPAATPLYVYMDFKDEFYLFYINYNIANHM